MDVDSRQRTGRYLSLNSSSIVGCLVVRQTTDARPVKTSSSPTPGLRVTPVRRGEGSPYGSLGEPPSGRGLLRRILFGLLWFA